MSHDGHKFQMKTICHDIKINARKQSFTSYTASQIWCQIREWDLRFPFEHCNLDFDENNSTLKT